MTYDYPGNVQMTFIGSQMTPRYFRSNRERYIGDNGSSKPHANTGPTIPARSGDRKIPADITVDALQEFVPR